MSHAQIARSACFILISLLVTACSAVQHPLTPTQATELLPGVVDTTPKIDQTITLADPDSIRTAVPAEDELEHLWAESGLLSPLEMPGIAAGAPEAAAGCGNELLAGYEEPASEVYLTLSYAQPLIPSMVNLVLKEMTDGISRVEILNNRTGLGREIYNDNPGRSSTRLADNDCGLRLALPVEIDFEVNTVIIGFNNLTAAALLDAVELVGRPVTFEEPLVIWRVPLDGAPLSLAVDALNQVWVSIEPDTLLHYDVEGNLLEETTTPSEGRIMDMTVDGAGNLVLNDGDFGEYIILEQGGEIARGGGDAPTLAVAVGPGQQNVYMLGELAGLYYLLSYLPESYEIINPLPLDGASYKSLAFNAENQLFTIRDVDGFLVEIDVLTGLEVNSIPLKAYKQNGVLPEDLAIDREGNYYVLFTSSPDKAAVKVYDADGFFSRSFGKLTDQPQSQWEEGSYFEPATIALTPDGRLAFIIDGYGDTHYLTCLLMRADQ